MLLLVVVVVVVAALAVVVFVLVLFVVVVMVAALTVVVLVLLLVVLFVVVVLVMALESILFKLFHLLGKGVAVLHGGKYFRTRKLLPGRGYKRRLGVVLANELYGIFKLVFARNVGVGEDYAVCRFYLVVEEFAEVLHIHFALCGVDYCRISVYFAVFELGAVYGADDVGELANARRLYENSVGIVLFAHLFKRLGKVADERAANATGVELVYFYACILQKSAVYADIAEFVFYKHEFFARIRFFNQLFYERGFARAEET